MDKTTTYTCTFVFKDKEYYAESKHGVHVFNSGFWVDSDMKLSTLQKDDYKIWIPPHKISYIEAHKHYDVRYKK